jgi:hypothetical protein
MERAAGVAAARSISQGLYYHRYTSGVKSEKLQVVNLSSEPSSGGRDGVARRDPAEPQFPISLHAGNLSAEILSP